MKIYELIRLAVEIMFTPISDDVLMLTFYEKTPSSDYQVITRRCFLLFY
ncbi:hypothetical protein GOICGAJE_04097 [Bacillus sp. MB95]|nr:hypothetical protein [Bacillus sp. MB95]